MSRPVSLRPRSSLCVCLLLALVGLAVAGSPAMAKTKRWKRVTDASIRRMPYRPPAGRAHRLKPGALPLLIPGSRASVARLRRAKARARARSLSAARPRTNVRPDSSANGFSTWQGLSGTTNSPSDASGAISGTHYVEFTNAGVGVYDRTNHALVSTTSLETFLGATSTSCEPYVVWDEGAQRFFYVASRCDGTTGSNMLYFGWSKTSDPTDLATGWCKLAFATAGERYDYPHLGKNATHMAIGVNVFNPGPPETYLRSDIVTFPKPANLDTSCTFPTSPHDVFLPAGQATPIPANMLDDSATGYVVVADVAPGSSINQYSYSGPSGGGAIVTFLPPTTVNPYSAPADAPMPSSSFVLDTLDGRLTNAVGGHDPVTGLDTVFTQHTIAGPGGRSEVRWYQFTYTGFSPALLQQADEASPTEWLFNGAISPTTDFSGAVLQFNASGPAAPNFPQVVAEARKSTDPPSTMHGQRWIFTASRSSLDFSCVADFGTCRWGRYASLQPDPSVPNAVWGSSMTTQSSPSAVDWTTRNFGVSTSEVTADESGASLNVNTENDQLNRLSIDPGSGTLTVTERSWPTVHALTGCTPTGAARADCSAAGITLVKVSAGAFGDTVANNVNVASFIDGGAGNDALTGGPAADTLVGGTGADRLSSGAADDEVFANDGQADTAIDCGPGTNDVAHIDLGVDPTPTNCETVDSGGGVT